MVDANGKSVINYLNSRTDLISHEDEKVRQNALSLLAAEIRLRMEDLDSLITHGLTDGPDDKKLDLVFFNNDFRNLYVVQGYTSPTTGGKQANSNKASDMTSAITWLIQGELSQGRPKVQKVAQEVREKLQEGVIEEIELWYVHNKLESQNVKNELTNAATTARMLIKNLYKDLSVNVRGVELGIETLEKDYTRVDSPILVNDTLDFSLKNGFEIESENWQTFFGVVEIEDLNKYWKKFETDLLAPNVRDFLGIRNSKKNINNGISDTLINNPENFLVYNNGITVLVNDYEWKPQEQKITVAGIGIVNGGQTTGTIGNTLEKGANIDGKVFVRFIKCTDRDVLRNIVKFNNTQNSVNPSDFRSTDTKQKKLVEEFREVYGKKVNYNGARRGEVLRMSPEEKKKTLTDKIVAQSLAAFSGESDLAYNRYSDIWENDSDYNSTFDSIGASHILFTSTLLKSVEKYKSELSARKDNLTSEDEKAYSYLINRGAHIVLVQAFSESMESILGNKSIADKKSLHFDPSRYDTIEKCMDLWAPLIEMFTSLFDLLMGGEEQLRVSNKAKIDSGVKDFTRMVAITMRNTQQPESIIRFRDAVKHI